MKSPLSLSEGLSRLISSWRKITAQGDQPPPPPSGRLHVFSPTRHFRWHNSWWHYKIRTVVVVVSGHVTRVEEKGTLVQQDRFTSCLKSELRFFSYVGQWEVKWFLNTFVIFLSTENRNTCIDLNKMVDLNLPSHVDEITSISWK